LSRVVGAYLCPRGAWLVESVARRGGAEVRRVIPAPAELNTEHAAAAHLVDVLASSGIRRAKIALTLRGFDVGHHVISLPSVRDSVLRPIVEREVRRLEPQLSDPVVGWMPLPAEPVPPEGPPQLHVLAAAAPRNVVDVIDDALRSAGHTLLHLTAVPAAMQRLHEELDGSTETTALVAPLPDGPFIGFLLAGALRLAVEPPLQEQAADAAAMAEELELGAMFIRQQFRGATIERVALAAAADVLPGAEEALAIKAGAPVSRWEVQGLGPAELAALAAVMDSRSPRPLALGGTVGARHAEPGGAGLRTASMVAVAAAVVVGAWTVSRALDGRAVARDLRDASRRVEQEAFGMRGVRETAEQRRLVRDALTALRQVNRERDELAALLARLAGAVAEPVRLDSLRMDRGSDGWVAALSGSVAAPTNGRAVQALHEFYRGLPAQLNAEQLDLEDMQYAEGEGATGVKFRLSFVVPVRDD